MKHRVRKAKKLGRPVGARRALYRNLLSSFFDKGSIETTISKAKAIKSQVEKIISIAKRGDLTSFRLIIALIGSVRISSKIVKEIAPQYTDRRGGFVRIHRTKARVGDRAQLARISLIPGKEVVREVADDAKHNDKKITKKNVVRTKIRKKEVKK
jgi:large subunit ribosomal protein L17